MPVRTLVIPRSQAGQTVAEVLQGTLRLARGVILQYVRDKQVRLAGKLCAAPGRRVRAVHRLDKETSGLVVLARTAAAETHLGLQFRAHSIDRQYLALVRGRARTERIETYLVRDRGDGRRGSGAQEQGQKAVTNI